jgi:hypothetical protein
MESNANTLAGKLAKATLDVGNFAADKKNKEQGYGYISADQVLERCGDALAKVGVVVIPSVIDSGVKSTERTDKLGNIKFKHVGKVTFDMLITDGASSEHRQWIGYGTDYTAEDKAIYKAVTTGHKYFLMKLLNIGIGNDDAEHDAHESSAYQQAQPRQTRQYRMEEPPQRQQAPQQREYDDDGDKSVPVYGQHQNEYPEPVENDWRKFPFPIPGDKKNTPLWKLSDKDLWYWIDNYKPKAQYPDNLRFREALDAARAELGGESDVAVQQRNPPARQPQRQQAQPEQSHVPAADEDDIPF